jgi:hypothetical protein
MTRFFVLLAILILNASLLAPARAQTSSDPAEAEFQGLNETELNVLLGPVALFPDPLLAILLPASTQPAEIVLAVRYLNSGGDPEQVDAQAWTDDVKAMAHYPELLRWMDENLEWTSRLGQAFLTQPEGVMDAIQRLRAAAQALGNLQTTQQQIVEVDEGGIDILPADPDVVYVPVYEPYVVYVRPAYLAPRPLISFDPPHRVGPWLNHDWDWPNRRVVIWRTDNFRPRAWWSQPRAARFQPTTKFQEWCPPSRNGRAPSKWWSNRQQQNHSAQTQTTGQSHGTHASGAATVTQKAPSSRSHH